MATDRLQENEAIEGKEPTGGGQPEDAREDVKMVIDLMGRAKKFRAEFDGDAHELRRAVFERASLARKAGAFSREEVIAAVASDYSLSQEVLERGLYSDLKSAQVLRSFEALPPEVLVENYVHGQVQGVLLKAVRVCVEVECADVVAYRWEYDSSGTQQATPLGR